MKSHEDIIKEVFKGNSFILESRVSFYTNPCFDKIEFSLVFLISKCMDMAVDEANRIPEKGTTPMVDYVSIVCKHSGKTCGESFNKIPECKGCEWNQELKWFTITTAAWQKCPVCEGEGIINFKTGEPPSNIKL